MFQRTTAINKLLQLKKFVKAAQGGSSAGKTYGIIPIEIDYCAKHPLTETSIVSESIPHLKRGAMKDFKKIMAETGRWFPERWNASDFKYTFANGSYIEFFSADVDSKLRGARRDRLYINEANNISFHAYTELASRTKQSVFMDWNPTQTFWFHEELAQDSDVDFVILTYKDNEAAPESAILFIEKAKEKAAHSSYWKNWYNVYGLGLIGSLQGVVFDNWHQIDEIPVTAKLICYGMDFGFTNDPTTLIGVWQMGDNIFVDELLYRTNMTNNDIGNFLKSINFNRQELICDSAEPKSIEELRRQGFNVHPAIKGTDSIRQGIDILKRQSTIYVTKSSVNLIKELRGYVWDTDKTGKLTGAPICYLNHCIDPLRYVAMSKLNNRPRGKYSTISI